MDESCNIARRFERERGGEDTSHAQSAEHDRSVAREMRMHGRERRVPPTPPVGRHGLVRQGIAGRDDGVMRHASPAKVLPYECEFLGGRTQAMAKEQRS